MRTCARCVTVVVLLLTSITYGRDAASDRQQAAEYRRAAAQERAKARGAPQSQADFYLQSAAAYEKAAAQLEDRARSGGSSTGSNPVGGGTYTPTRRGSSGYDRAESIRARIRTRPTQSMPASRVWAKSFCARCKSHRNTITRRRWRTTTKMNPIPGAARHRTLSGIATPMKRTPLLRLKCPGLHLPGHSWTHR